MGIAALLYAAAAVLGPSGSDAPSRATNVRGAVSGAPSPTTSPTPPPVVPRDQQGRTASPVATVEQVVEEEVGSYTLADEGISLGGPEGALQSAQLRYTEVGGDHGSDVFHGVEVHLDPEAARRRVRAFGSALNASGFRVVRREDLESAGGSVQGMFFELRRGTQRLLVWSNRNVFFSLGGGTKADIDTFYDDLPY